VENPKWRCKQLVSEWPEMHRKQERDMISGLSYAHLAAKAHEGVLARRTRRARVGRVYRRGATIGTAARHAAVQSAGSERQRRRRRCVFTLLGALDRRQTRA
jgi:hypothetical protein